MKRIIVKREFSLLLCLLWLVTLAGCTFFSEQKAQNNPAPGVDKLHIINPIGPLVIPISGLASNSIEYETPVEVQYWKTIDEVIGLLSGEQVEFAVLPISTGVNLASSGLDLVLLGVHEWRIFYLVASSEVEFTGWDSLRGKTIYTPESKGQTVDVLTRYALKKEDITPDKDVTFLYAPAQEIVALFKEGKIEFAALPEPFATQAIASDAGKIVVDYQDYWCKASGSAHGIPIAGLFAKRSFTDAHPDKARIIAKMLADSTRWANENPGEALRASSTILPLSEDVMKAAMARMKFEYIPASQAKGEVMRFLSDMQQTYPEGIKVLPKDDFFFQ